MLLVKPSSQLHGRVHLPSSKPHGQRALLLAALAQGESLLKGIDLCAESQLIFDGCTAMGASFRLADEDIYVQGFAGKPRKPTDVVRVKEAGVALRTMLAIASLGTEAVTFEAGPGLAQRPMDGLVKLLTAQGADILRVEDVDKLSLVIKGSKNGLSGGRLSVPAESTSQFLTSMLLIAPFANSVLEFDTSHTTMGQHYFDITVEMLREFGADVTVEDEVIKVAPRPLMGTTVTLTPDVTSLACFLMAALVTDVDVIVKNGRLGVDPLTDEAIAVARRLGVRVDAVSEGLHVRSGTPPDHQVDINVANVPTITPMLAAAAPYLPHEVRVSGARHVKFHKTDRLGLVMEELKKIGHILLPLSRDGVIDGFHSKGRSSRSAKHLDSHGDHRLFMALFVGALGHDEPITVSGKERMTLSFPRFTSEFSSIGVQVIDLDSDENEEAKVGQ